MLLQYLKSLQQTMMAAHIHIDMLCRQLTTGKSSINAKSEIINQKIIII
jgi:hypothetical protein